MATSHASGANQPDSLFPAGSSLSVPYPDGTLSGGAEIGARVRDFEKLVGAALDISAPLKLAERAQRIAWHARDMAGARHAVVWMVVRDDDDPLVAASRVDDEAPAVALIIRDMPRLAGGDERLGHSLRLSGQQVADDPWLRTLAAPLDGATRGWLSAPLTARDGRAIGLVLVADKAGLTSAGAFSADDEDDLVRFARLAASALENAAHIEEIQRSITMRDAALFMVTHDLKQPLTAVKANVQMLQRQARRSTHLESAHLRERLATIDETTDKMTDQINELLDLARLQAGQPLELELQPVELVAFVEQLVNEQRQTAARHSIQVESEVAQLSGTWDAPRVARVLGNLLSNAVKYSPAGGEVLLCVRREERGENDSGGPWALVSVSDHGLGIPRADLPHIFEPFHRASNAVHENIPGTGIGLASARHVVTQHGGALTVESRVGEGTTFTLRLPLEPPANA